ncbi:hypothetical protein BDR06DRAFT_977564 [Suillus hirtellus]|nr:hypothetical protein BDR06DRAFT_977564 [Suillus hirtellus]
MASENVQEFAHPNNIAAMQAEWAQACAEHEYLKAHRWSSAALQVIRDNQTSFPTSNQFTAPVAGLLQFPSMDQNQYSSRQATVVPQLSLKGHACFYSGDNGGSYATVPNFTQNHLLTVVDLERWVAEPRTYGNAHAGTIMDTMSDTENFLQSASDSDATTYPSDDSSLETSSAPIGQTRQLFHRQ